MVAFQESEEWYGNEPDPREVEKHHPNGGVISEPETIEHSSQDEHYAYVERLVDAGVANNADASRMLHYDPSDYDENGALLPRETVASPGVSVSLEERAYAVGELMDGIAMHNKTAGAKASGAIGKYDNPRLVMNRMENKDARYEHTKREKIELLAKSAALRAIGFDDNEAAASTVAIRRELSDYEGTGPRAQAARNKQKRMTRKTADKVNDNEQ